MRSRRILSEPVGQRVSREYCGITLHTSYIFSSAELLETDYMKTDCVDCS
jgi:hypothetical protein